MKKNEVERLQPGLYKIFWKKKAGGGSSLAAVGIDCDGLRWMACSNWIVVPSFNHWDHVKKVKLVSASPGIQQ